MCNQRLLPEALGGLRCLRWPAEGQQLVVFVSLRGCAGLRLGFSQ